MFDISNNESEDQIKEKIKQFFDECRELPAKQLQEFKDLIIPDIIFVCVNLGIEQPNIEVYANNWLCARVMLKWHDIELSLNVIHQAVWKEKWLDSREDRIKFLKDYLIKNKMHA